MKKTMFITSVIMVVVLAIALTTSSLAWFQAGGATQVAVSNVVVTAATTSSVSGLELSVDNSNWHTSAINFYDEGTTVLRSGEGTVASPYVYTTKDGLLPMCPVGVKTEDDNSKITHQALYDAVLNMATNKTASVDGELQFTDNYATTSAFTKEFYIRNSGAADINSVTVSLNLATVGLNGTSYAATMWVALFDITSVTDQSTAGVELLGLISNKDNNGANPDMTWAVNSSALAANAPALSVGSSAYANIKSKVTFDLEGATEASGATTYHPHTLLLVCWYDGASLNNLNTATTVSVGIGFEIA